MHAGDLAAAHQLSQAVGWGHRFEDWKLLLEVGKGVVSESEDGDLSGVAMWWPYGTDFAAVGMVIVSPSHQRCGIGKILMDTILSEAGDRRVMLNATKEGTRLYESLGFTPSGSISTHYGQLAPDRPPVAGAGIRRLQPDDWMSVARLDREASGMDRTSLLAALREISEGFIAQSDGRTTGFILPRRFQKGTLLGPVIADDEQTAIALMSAAASHAEGLLRADIPGDATIIADWLERAGLPSAGQVTTMWLPRAPEPNGRARVYGLTAQAVG
jgi:GNAT superfamily N-acetyltransferase